MMILAHYSKGAFSVMDLYQMPVYLRTYYFKEFNKLKEEEAKEVKRAAKK